jgi:hypothetical protein
MLAVPDDTPVTVTEAPEADTDATEALLVDHVPPVVALDNVVLAPTHNV